jgi:hypothetical protein
MVGLVKWNKLIKIPGVSNFKINISTASFGTTKQNPRPTARSPVTELLELPSATAERMHIINGFFVIPMYLNLTERIVKHRNQDIHVFLFTLNE